MRLNLLQKHRCLRVPARFGPLLAGALAGDDRRLPGEVNVVLTDDGQVRRLNREFLGRDRPTDVLAFNLDSTDDPHPGGIAGEVYVSADRAREQARERGHPFGREVLILALHGLYHLLGETDRTPVERRRMAGLVESALDSLGPSRPEARADR